MKKMLKVYLLTILSVTVHGNIDTEIQLEKANQLIDSQEYPMAMQIYNDILDSAPENALFGIARCYFLQHRYEKAFEYFVKIHNLHPQSINPLFNMNMCVEKLGNFDDSAALLEKILKLDPSNPQWNIKLQWRYIQAGKLDILEERWQNFDESGWENIENVRNKTILLPIGDWGLGDAFMYVRWARSLKNHGARVIVEVMPTLVPIISLCPYIDKVVTKQKNNENYDAKFTVDYFYFLIQALKGKYTENEPYLFAHPQLIDLCKQYFIHDKNLKVGLFWFSNFVLDYHNKRAISPRSIDPTFLAPLNILKNISFYCLHRNKEKDYTTPSFIHHFDAIDEKFGAFMDTAAIIKNLDLVITVDTSIAHLAGGLGVPVWLMLNVESDVRWFLNRSDSPFYPTMRIFRQKKLHDWSDVIQEVLAALQELKNKKR
jgi:hypothetical protein